MRFLLGWTVKLGFLAVVSYGSGIAGFDPYHVDTAAMQAAGLKDYSEFLRQVRAELKKVAWPSRHELVSYTIVVLVSVVVLTSFVFGLDFFFSKVVLRVFGQGA